MYFCPMFIVQPAVWAALKVQDQKSPFGLVLRMGSYSKNVTIFRLYYPFSACAEHQIFTDLHPRENTMMRVGDSAKY